MDAIGYLVIVVIIAALLGGSGESVLFVFGVTVGMIFGVNFIEQSTNIDSTIVRWSGFVIWSCLIYLIRKIN